jgi:CHAD domain-containing protein
MREETCLVKETLEREVKLSVGSDFTLPALQTEATPRHLRAVYYDTEDQRLARHGVTLRRRLEDGRDLWQLKLPSDDDRLELEEEADGPDIPADFTRLLTAFTRGAELRPLAELHTLRRALRVTEDGKPSAEVVHDAVDVYDGDRVVRSFAEVEIEQIAEGAERLVERLEKQLRAAGAKRSDGRPKLFRALDLPARSRPRIKRGAPAIEHLRAYLQTQVASLLEHDPATRRHDPAGVHGMRVATRRMRSALKEARRLLDPDWVRETRSELKWLADLLGDVRDADVFASYVEQRVAQLGEAAAGGGADLVTLIQERSQPSRARLAAELESPRYLALLDRLDSIETALPVARSRESMKRILRRAVRRAGRTLRRVSPTSSDHELHRARIAAKRARYAGELALPSRGRAAERLAKRAEAIQTLLGDHQDSVVAEQRLQSLAQEASSAAAFVAGRIAERERDRREAVRARLPKKAKRFFAAARRV